MRDGWLRFPPDNASKKEDWQNFGGESNPKLTVSAEHVRLNIVRAHQLQTALKHLSAAVQETESALAEMRAESDPLALHIFVSRRQYRNLPDSKGGRRHETAARMSWQIACNLGFRGSLGEWEKLMGTEIKR